MNVAQSPETHISNKLETVGGGTPARGEIKGDLMKEVTSGLPPPDSLIHSSYLYQAPTMFQASFLVLRVQQ